MERLKSNLAKVLGTAEGKEVFRFLFELTGVLGAGGDYNSDALHAAYLEGQRGVGIKFYRLIMEAEPQYLQLITHKIIEEQAENGRRNKQHYSE